MNRLCSVGAIFPWLQSSIPFVGQLNLNEKQSAIGRHMHVIVVSHNGSLYIVDDYTIFSCSCVARRSRSTGC